MRFVCDSTVGKLARLLRMAGLDTAYVKENSTAQVLALSKEENRVIVSRNSKYSKLQMADSLCLLDIDEPIDQFREIIAILRLELDEKLFLTRCLQCNGVLEEIDAGSVRERLIEFVAKTQTRIFICRRCDKLFWHATHAHVMVGRLLAIKSELDQKPDNKRA